MWITLNWYSFRPLWVDRRLPNQSIAIKPFRIAKSVTLMRKTIVINTLLILGYYLVLQLLIWVAMVLR